jgi:hypothetical protein
MLPEKSSGQAGYYKFKYPEKAVVTGPGSSLTLVTGI